MNRRSAKNKGNRLQVWVYERFLTLFGLDEGEIRPAQGGEHGMDIKAIPRSRDRYPYAVECKNQEKISIWQAWKQAELNSEGHTPLVIFKRNHSDVMVLMTFEEFERLHNAKKETD